MNLGQERMQRTNFDERVVGVASEESVGQERNDCSYGRCVQNSNTVYRRVRTRYQTAAEGSGMERTSGAAP